MVFQVRCFKCGAHEVRLILGGRQILHARCQSCHTNLLAEVMAFEQDANTQQRTPQRERLSTAPGLLSAVSRNAPEFEQDVACATAAHIDS